MRFRSLWRAAAMAFAAAALLGAATTATAATLPNGFNDQTLVSGLTAPTAVAWTPDGRMLIAEKSGVLKVVPAGGGTATTLLDISGHVNDYWDRGLLGLAVDGDFASNHYVYLLYVYDSPPLHSFTGAKSSRLTRIVVNDNNTVANPASPETVLVGTESVDGCGSASNDLDCIPADGIGHMVGTVRSAPDGTLWAGSGDSADFSGPDTAAFRSYDEHSFAGKIIHVDRDGKGLAGHPFCPADSNLNHVCAKVYAKGFRNPFRFTLQPDGNVIAGDVGWNSVEEIDVLRPGGNYGWPCYEAATHNAPYADFQDSNGSAPCPALYALEGGPSAVDAPIYQYPHVGSSAVLVGPTYSGDAYPPGFQGDLFFGDYARGFIKRLKLDDHGTVDQVVGFAEDLYGFVDLEASPRGNLTFVEFGDGSTGSGSVEEITRDDLVAEASATPDSGPAPLEVKLDSSQSTDATNQQLSFDWDFGDGSPHSSDPSPTHSYAAGGYTARLTVTNEDGHTDTDQVAISSGTPPTVSIDSPDDESMYQDGVQVDLSGSGSDDQDGTLDGNSLEWHVVARHLTHTHSLGTFHGAEASFVPVTDHDTDAFYEITLTATNSIGLHKSDTIELHPQTAWFGVYSYPQPNAPLTRGGQSGPAPVADWSAVGFQTVISAQESYIADGSRWVFDAWTDGGDRSHQVTVTEDGSIIVALYHPEPLPPDSDPNPDPGSDPGSEADPLQPLQALGPISPVDAAGPTLGLDRLRSKRHRIRRLSGAVSDPTGVRAVEIAILRHRRGGLCSWLTASRRRMSTPGDSCQAPVWLKTNLTAAGPNRWAWSASLESPLRRGSYSILLRAHDGLGNVSSLTIRQRVRGLARD
jgi:glucose/arabinose dehydrogenase